MKRSSFLLMALTTLVVASSTFPLSAAQAAVTITEFSVNSVYGPGPIAAGADAVWFAEPSDDEIGRVDLSGHVTQYPLPSPYEEPRGITVGPDGAAWFTMTGGHTGGEGIGRIESGGAIQTFALPSNTRPFGIASGPDGFLWFTVAGANWRIGRISTAGMAEQFATDLQNRPLNIVAGPDGAMWFTEDGIVNGGVGAIGRITTTGVVTEFPLPTPVGFISGAGDITAGPDGNLWFTWVEQDASETGPAAHSVGRITTAGVITEFPLSTDQGWPPGGIAATSDGSLWVARGHANTIAQVSTAGVIVDHPVPTAGGFPVDVAAGADGNVWFSEGEASQSGRINLAPGSGSHRRAVTLTLARHLVARGRLSSEVALPACWEHAPVKVERRVEGGWRTVARGTTNAKGAFKVALADVEGRYRAVAGQIRLAGGDVCRLSTSSRVMHRHG